MNEEPPPYISRRVRSVAAVQCVECGRRSEGRWRGWGAYRINDPESDDPPELAFYCPGCRRDQFDH